MNHARLVSTAAVFALAATLSAQSLGQFTSNGDVGAVLHAGSASYDKATKQYTVTGSGENMWWATDAFQFVWVKVSGDVSISASATFPKPGGDNHRKAALMIRQSLDADSAYVDASLHGDGLTSLQTRTEKGANTWEIQAPIKAPVRYQLTKDGDQFSMSVAAEGETLHPSGGAVKLALKEPFYIGIAVCARNKDDIQTAVFSNVDLKHGAAKGKRAVQSTVEAVPAPAGDRRALYTVPGTIADASLTSDGALIYTLNGKSYQLNAGAKTPTASKVTADPAGAPKMNAPGHNVDPTLVASDGAIYFASDRSGSWQIWKMNADSSAPAQVTNDDFSSYAPRLSPDKTRLVFLSTAKSEKPIAGETDVQLRTLSLTDGKLGVLARFVGGAQALGANCWTEDGKRVVYVSNQRLPVAAK